MKLSILKWAGLLVFLCVANNVVARTNQLYELYLKRDFISLEDQLKAKQWKRKEKATFDVFNAMLLNAYGQRMAARENLQKQNLNLQNDTLKFLRLKILNDVAFQDFNYLEAYETGTTLLNNYKDRYPTEEYDELIQVVKIANILKNSPAQEVVKTGNTTLDIYKDRAGLSNIPVSINDTLLSLVFDSGAGMSVISESLANKLRLTIVSDSTVQVSGSGGKKTTSKLALVNNIQIGNINVSNVAFLVFPDSALSFGEGIYKMDGIIGFPVIKEFGSLTFIKQRQLFIPQKVAKSRTKPNMILDNLQPILILNYFANQDFRLPFTFDTGANKTTISRHFYQRFSYNVETNGQLGTRVIEGVGGKKTYEGFHLGQILFKVNNHPLKLNNVFVFKEPFIADGEGFYGNIGQDAIEQFERVTIDFKQSFIKFSNPV